MKISLFVHNLSSNPIVRAYPIAKALQQLGYEIEVLGLTYYNQEVYAPYRDAFTFKTIHTYDDIRWVIINGIKLSKMATGDIVYAFKPLWGTYWPALLYARFGLKRRIILDAEDEELWDAFIGNGWKILRKNTFYPINPIYNKALHPFTFLARRKTVVSRKLQKRYGGIILLHGPDEKKYDENLLPHINEIRSKYDLPVSVPLLLFAGRPVFYNGLPHLIEILQMEAAHMWHLVLVGDKNEPLFQQAKMQLGEKCHLIGTVPNSQMPEILKMVDIVPILQDSLPSTVAQVPAKMIEAMAMGKGIIATNVGDLPELLDEERGWIVDLDNKHAIAKLLSCLAENVTLIDQRGRNAKMFFNENASVQANSMKLKNLI